MKLTTEERTSSPSSTSTRCPRSLRPGATTPARVDLPAPDSPVSQRTKPVSLVMLVGTFPGSGRDGGAAGRRSTCLLPVGRDEDLGDLRPAELRRRQLAGGQLGADLGPGEGQVVLGLVRAGLACGHPA